MSVHSVSEQRGDRPAHLPPRRSLVWSRKQAPAAGRGFWRPNSLDCSLIMVAGPGASDTTGPGQWAGPAFMPHLGGLLNATRSAGGT